MQGNATRPSDASPLSPVHRQKAHRMGSIYLTNERSKGQGLSGQAGIDPSGGASSLLSSASSAPEPSVSSVAQAASSEGDGDSLLHPLVTPEMIEAGINALSGWENEIESAHDAVERIYLAMQALSPVVRKAGKQPSSP